MPPSPTTTEVAVATTANMLHPDPAALYPSSVFVVPMI